MNFNYFMKYMLHELCKGGVRGFLYFAA